MKFSCEKCGAQYMISDDKVGPNGVRVRCKKCSSIVSVKRAPRVAPEIEPAPPPPTPESVPVEAGAAGTPSDATLDRELGNAFDSVFGDASAGGDLSAGLEAGQQEHRPPPAADVALPAPSEEKAPAASSVTSAEAVQDWYVAIEDSQVGPLQAPLVKARWESGEVGPDTLAWRPGMGDWMPLSSIPEMAQYLAPVPRGSVEAAPRAREDEEQLAMPEASLTTAPGAPAAANGAAADQGEEPFKPSAGSALAALASEEISFLAKPEPKPEPAASTSPGNSLMDRLGLPDGGVDPTNIVPLPIKGLEPTGESELPPRPGAAAPETNEIRKAKRSATRTVMAVAVALVVLFGGGMAVVVSILRPQREPPAPAPLAKEHAPAPAPPPIAAEAPAALPPAAAVTPPPAPAPAAPAPLPAPAASTPPATASAPSEATPAATDKAAPPTEPRPATPAPSERQAASRRDRKAKAAEAVAARQAKAAEAAAARQAKRASRVALAERAPASPAAEPAHKKTDPLLDVGDDDVEKELSGRAPKSSRSVYVPPAIGSDLPQSVSVSQINEAVRGQTSSLQRCVDQQKAADPDTRGTLKVRWIISADGTVRDVRIVSDEFSRQPIAPCISGVIKSVRFPRSRTTGQEVVFPFKF